MKLTIKLKFNLVEYLYIFSSIAVLLCCFFKLFANYRIEMYTLMFIFVWILVLTFRYRNFSLYQIFLITFFFFLLGRIFLDCIGVYDFRELSLYQSRYMSEETAVQTLSVLMVFLIGSSYGWLLSKDTNGKKYFDKPINKLVYDKILQYLYYIFICLFILKMVYLFRYVREFGYLAIFRGEITSLDYPVIFTGAATISEILFVILLFYNRDSQSFKKYAILYLIAGATKMLTGQRGYFFVLAVFLVYIWSTYYKQIKFINLRLIILVLIVPILIQWIWEFRYRTGTSLLEILKGNVYFSILESQGVSLEVVADTIIFKDQFTNKVPFFLGYFVDLFKREPSGQVMEDITNGNYLGDHLTYTLNHNTFFAGHGTGTSLVAEIYELFNGNLFLIMIFAMLIVIFILFIAKRAYKSIYWYGISFYLIKNFIYSPRDSILKNLIDIIIIVIVCFVVSYLNTVIQGKYKSIRPG